VLTLSPAICARLLMIPSEDIEPRKLARWEQQVRPSTIDPAEMFDVVGGV
jgi:hypothetical protein